MSTVTYQYVDTDTVSIFDTVPLLQHTGELMWLDRKRLRSFDMAIEKELLRFVRCVKNCLNYVHTAAC